MKDAKKMIRTSKRSVIASSIWNRSKKSGRRPQTAAMVFKEEAENEDPYDKVVNILDSSGVDGSEEGEGDSENSANGEGSSASLGSNNASNENYHILDLCIEGSEFDSCRRGAK